MDIDRIEELENEINDIEAQQKGLSERSDEWKSLEQARWFAVGELDKLKSREV